MASPVLSILPNAPIEWDPATSWREYLEEQFTWAQREARLQMESQHPGTRHRIVDLRICAADRRRQIAALRMRAEAFGS